MYIFFPIHLDGGNRGCEGIAKGTAMILGLPKERLIGLSNNIKLDESLGIHEYVSLEPKRRESICYRIINKLYRILASLITKEKYNLSVYNHYYHYYPFINKMRKGDVMLSTGGDMMCYDDNQIITTNNYAKKFHIKTILWACSMGETNLSPRKLDTLKKFDVIYARESLSFAFFKSLELKNVISYPDPAFVLEPEYVDLPEIFKKGDVLGLNLSNYVVGDISLNTPFGIEVKKLIEYVLNKTTLSLLLIPHVTWAGQDDRIIADIVKKNYQETERVEVLDISNLNYLQIRYVISKCRFFIGGRTHAVISAYSTCVPTIALGYSIKSKGIAKDLGINERYVVDSKDKDVDLPNVFSSLMKEESVMKKHLEEIIPQYKDRFNGLRSKLFELLC